MSVCQCVRDENGGVYYYIRVAYTCLPLFINRLINTLRSFDVNRTVEASLGGGGGTKNIQGSSVRGKGPEKRH